MVRSFMRPSVWSPGGSLDSFSSLWAACAYQRIVNITQLYIESSNMELIRFRKQPMKSTRLACSRLDSRYNISLFDSFLVDLQFHGVPGEI